MSQFDLQGIGMTSQRTQDRLVARFATGASRMKRCCSSWAACRDIFIDEAWSHRAYEDSSLPIGHGQTISQPFIVALMSQLLNVQPGAVLEVHRLGLSTAILASCVSACSHRRSKPLYPGLRSVLRDEVAQCQGALWGWLRQLAENAPFDGILVTAAPPEIPAALMEQLAVGGRMVVR